MVGQTLLVVGDHEHDGNHHFLIRQPHGGSYQVPDWMFGASASTAAIVTVPRLPVGQLILLRGLVDRLIACPSANRYRGGTGHEGVASHANGTVRLTGAAARAPQLITLLRALLMEAVTYQSSVPASGGVREPGNE